MRRFLSLTLAAVLMSALFSGCQTRQPEDGDSDVVPPDVSPVSYQFTIATGGTGGTYYPYGGAMAEVWSGKISNLTVTAVSTGASVENTRLLDQGEADFAILQNDVLDYAYHGYELFAETEKMTDLAAVVALYPEVLQIVVAADSGIEGVEDMRGKRISVGAAGSGVEANARQILEMFEMAYGDLSVSYLSFAESSKAVQTDEIDGFFCTSGLPNTAVLELQKSVEIRLIPIPPDKASALSGRYGFYSEYIIPADTYGEEVPTVALMAVLACRRGLGEEIVYEMVKTLFESKPELQEQSDKAGELTLETAVEALSVPLHPGAERFLRESGALG